MRNGIHQASLYVDKAVRWATVVLGGSFTLLVFLSVLTRYVFNAPILFSQEVSKLLFIWSAFLAATIAFRGHQHIRFEFLDAILKPKGKAITDILLYSACLVFFVVVGVNAVKFTRIIWGTSLPVLKMSQGWLYVSVIVSSVIFLLHSIDLLISSIEEFGK